MKHAPPWRNVSPALLIMVCVLARPCAAAEAVSAQRLDGFNVIEVAGHPFGSASAKLALANAKHLGAGAIAIIPFLWQPQPASPSIRRGNDMADIELRVAIRDAHALGLAAIVLQGGQVVQRHGHFGMRVADQFAPHRKCLSIERFSAFQIALILQVRGKVLERAGELAH